MENEIVRDDLWLGSLDSAEGYIRYQQFVMENPTQVAEMHRNPQAFLPDDDDEGNPMQPKFESHLLESFGNVAVMNISGGMVNNDSFITRMFGLTTYPEIIRATAELMEAEDITDVVLNFDSGGGTVSGLEDAGRALASLAKMKPVYSATSGRMASAAYWLGSIGKKVSVTPMSQTGSIGVIATHVSMKGRLDKEGIKPTIFRAGEHKAPGHPMEDLDAEQKKVIQKEMDSMYGFFLDHVAEQRGLDIQAKDVWAEGRMFFGREAIGVGLADDLNPPEAVIASLEKREPSNNTTGEMSMGIETKRTVLLNSKEDLAAAAAGAPLDELEHEEVEGEQPGAEDQGTDAQAAAGETPAAEGQEGNEETPTPSAASPAAFDGSFLQQLTQLSAENALLKRDLESSKTAMTALQGDTNGMLDIVAEATNRMEIGMRQATTKFDGLSPAAAIAKYASVKEQFNATFKIGRVSAENVETEQPKVFQLGIIPKK